MTPVSPVDLRRFLPRRFVQSDDGHAALRDHAEANLRAWLALGYRPSTVKACPHLRPGWRRKYRPCLFAQPSWLDHGQTWRRDTTLVLTSQPYQVSVADEAQLWFDCLENDLTAVVLPAARAWWYPGVTRLIVVGPAAEVATVRTTWGDA
jgi:hypothetical protein